MVLDLKELKGILEHEVMQRMDHRFLNYEVAELKGKIPTCENIAKVIWELLDTKIKQGRLHRVRLYESAALFADCIRSGVAGAWGERGWGGTRGGCGGSNGSVKEVLT